MQQTHKYCFPVLVKGEIKWGVFRKIPGTRKLAYCGRHGSIRACCAALKKRFPAESSAFTPTELLLEKPKPRECENAKRLSGRHIKRVEKIQFQGVTPETRPNGKVVWKVHHKYNTPKWRYDSQMEAAAAIVRAEGITLADLKHKTAKLPRLQVKSQQELHGKAMGLYAKRRPGDLVNLDMHAKRPKTWKAMKCFPGIIPAFFLAKVAADRKKVVDSAIELWRARKNVGEEKQHYDLFVRASRKISQRTWSKAEEQSIGRNNFHWMNYHTLMTHLNILSLRRLPNDKSKGLVFQNSGTEYYVRPWSDEIQGKIRNHIAWGKRCLATQTNLPKNANDYVACNRLLDAGLQKLVGAMSCDGYSRKWLKRAWMRFMLVRFNVKINFRSLTVRDFIRCWPDQHNLLSKLLQDPKNKNLHSTLASQVGPGLDRLEYKDEAELLSMHACLVDDWDAQTVLRKKGPEWVSRNWRELRRRLDAWYWRDGIYPHPGVFFLQCCDLD